MNDTDQNVEAPPQRTHVDVRREAAEAFVRDSQKEGAELVEIFERAMIMAERRGVNECFKRLLGRVAALRSKLAFGPANHLEEGVKALHFWFTSSAEFLTKKEFDEAREPGLIKPETPQQSNLIVPPPRSFIGAKN